MYRQIFNAKLEGYEGPFFPAGIETINETYRKTKIQEWSWLEEFVRYSPMYVGITKPTTSDGHEWFGSVTFKAPRGFIKATFPQPGDDRSVAFYFQGEVTGEEKNQIVLCLAVKMHRIPHVIGTSRKYGR